MARRGRTAAEARRQARATAEKQRRARARAELAQQTQNYQASARPTARKAPKPKPKVAPRVELKQKAREYQAAARPVVHRKPATEGQKRYIKRKRLEASIARAGFDPRELSGGKSFGERFARDLQETATGLPGGVYQISKAAALDVRDNPLLAAGVVPGVASALLRDKPIAKRLGGAGKAIAKQYAKDYSDPIGYFKEHPGLVLLDAGAALSAGAGTASRVSAAGSAARAASAAGKGSRVGAALARPAYEGGSLLRRPLPGRRVHYYEGERIAGRYSDSAFARGVQKAADKRAIKRGKQRLAKDREARLFDPEAPRPRLSTISARKAARLLDEERRILTAAEQAPALKIAAREKRHTPLEQVAVDAVAVGLPIDEHVAALRRLAAEAKGKMRKRLSRRAELIERSRGYLDESSGKPNISDRFPELQDTVALARAAIEKTEADLKAAGLLTEEGAKARVQAPGRVLLGARFEPKSIAELQGPQFNLIGKRVRSSDGMRGAIVDVVGDEAKVRLWRKGNPVVTVPLDELYAASGRFKEGRLVGGGRAIQVERPKTLAEAEARAAKLEAATERTINAATQRLIKENPGVYVAGGRGAHGGTRRVQDEGFKIGRGQTGYFKEDPRPVRAPAAYKTGEQKAREVAEKKLYELGTREDAHPSARAFAQAVDELAELRRRINAEKESVFSGRSALRELYQERAKTRNVIDTDEVRLLIPGYARLAPEERAAAASKYHAAASRGADRLYDEMLRDAPEKGTVAIMAGGSGAGKSSARVNAADHDIVLDTTFSGLESAAGKIDRALESGRSVVINYVHRDPAKAYSEGVLSTARLTEDGRVVPIATHVRNHVGANETIRKLAERYAGDDRVRIRVIDNSKKGAPEIGLAGLPRLKYHEVDKEVRRAFEAQAGRLSEGQRQAALRADRGGARQAGGEGVGAGARQTPGALTRGGEGLDEFPLFGSRTETVGSVPFTGGEFRVPEFRRARPPKAGMFGWRGGVPRKPGTLVNPYTGAGRRTATNQAEKSLRAIAEDLVEKQRYLDAERHRQRILPMGVAKRPADTRKVKYAPVRVRPLSRAESDKFRRAMSEVDVSDLSPEVASRLDEVLIQFRETLFPQKEYATVAPGTEIPGIVWVDEKLVANQRKIIGSLGPLDTIQDAAKGLILYAKPGYVTPNVLGNAALNIFQQGFLAPVNWIRAGRMDKELGYMVDSVMGHGYTTALAAGTKSPITKGVTVAADFWSRFVDVPFRRAAFIHEARRHGYKTQAQQKALIEGSHPQLTEITQRARDAIIDYERLGAVERDLVRRLLFVYPWVKGSTYYSVQFLRDHPIQAAVFAALAQQGNQRNLEELGPMPAWARGTFKVFERDGKPYGVNPAAISPFSTPASVLATARGGLGQVERSENIGEMTSPVFQSAVEAAFGRDLFTGRELEGGYPQRFVEQLGKGLPQVTLVRRLRNEPKEDAAYPYGPISAAGQFIGGSSSPRPLNLQTLNEQAAGGIDPARRIARENLRERKAVIAGIEHLKPELFAENPSLRKRIVTAYGRKQEVDLLRRAVEQDLEPGVEREREKLRREVELLRGWGVLSPKKAAQLAGVARSGSVDDVKAWRNVLREEGFENEYLGLLREARDAAEVEE